ncbi:MAG: hypothetical protein WKG07_25115 [Hymenobacter sp.]
MMIRFRLLFANYYSLSPAAHAQARYCRPTYRNLVLEGGGIRGIAYGGALQELESRGVLAGIRRVGGTSAGGHSGGAAGGGLFGPGDSGRGERDPVQRLNDGQFLFVGGTRGW